MGEDEWAKTYVRNVAQLLAMQYLPHALVLRLGRVLGHRVGLADGAGHDGDAELTREALVAGKELFGLGAGDDEVRVFGHPGREVVLGEDGEVAAVGGGLADVGFCLGEVGGRVDGLGRERRKWGLVVVECPSGEVGDGVCCCR